MLGLVQGIAEPFPVSSLGHAVIIPGLAGWSFQRANDDRYPHIPRRDAPRDGDRRCS